MKVYIHATIDIDRLKEQQAADMNERQFNSLLAIDPTTDVSKNKAGKYCLWILKQFKKGNLKESDYMNLTDALEYFNKHGKKFEEPDIGRYATVQDFLDAVEEVGNRPLTEKERAKQLKKQAHHAGDDDKKFCVADGVWEVWQPLTKAGSISLAQAGGHKARWCTAYDGDDHWWNSYTSRGPLYIFLNTTNPDEKYQLHFQSDSWFDIDDRSLGMPAFYQFCSEHPAIGDYFEVKLVDGMQLCAGSLVGFDKNSTEFNVPEGVTQLSIAFPSGTQRVTLPDSLTSIGPDVFSRAQKTLTQVTLSNGLTTLPRGLFEHCTSLTSIEIPDSVTSYWDNLFLGCTSLKHIKNSNALQHIGARCFSGCTALEDLTIPDTVTELGDKCFEGAGFTTFTVPSEVNRLLSVFDGDTSIEAVDLNNVTEIGWNAFRSSSISQIDLSNIEKIGSGAFSNCANLTSVTTLKPGVKLTSTVFANCSNLTNVIVPDGAQLGMGVFNNCPNLTLRWETLDEAYPLDDIELLICDESCTELIEENKGFIRIQTFQGDVYEVQ